MDMGSTRLCLIFSVVDGLTALDTASGEIQWERTPGDNYGASMEVVGDTPCLLMDRTVHGYALPDGTHRWNQSLSRDERFVRPAPSRSSRAGDLYIADDRANLTALNVATGDEQWSVETNWGDQGYEGTCLGTESLLYHSGTALASYDLVDGTQQWVHSLGSGYEADRPFIAERTMVLPVREKAEQPSVKGLRRRDGPSTVAHRASDTESATTTVSGRGRRSCRLQDRYAAHRPLSPSSTAQR
jgi:outer membrane protein assembly factor BamB